MQYNVGYQQEYEKLESRITKAKPEPARQKQTRDDYLVWLDRYRDIEGLSRVFRFWFCPILFLYYIWKRSGRQDIRGDIGGGKTGKCCGCRKKVVAEENILLYNKGN